MSNKKKLQDLTIRDNFMFAAVMMRDDNCRRFLEMEKSYGTTTVTVFFGGSEI